VSGQAPAPLPPVRVPLGDRWLQGDLRIPPGATALVLFAHGSGSSRLSPRNRYVAHVLRAHGLGTLLIDLLTPEEEAVDAQTGHFRFDINLLASRLVAIVDWLRRRKDTAPLTLGIFGASTGGGAALVAAAARPHEIAAVVSRGGRPDLARDALPLVKAPTLLIVGERDVAVIGMNREAMGVMRARVDLQIVPDATHLFEEPGALDRVAELAAAWFGRHLRAVQQAHA
jgi:putative phosphoribosyl transferase